MKKLLCCNLVLGLALLGHATPTLAISLSFVPPSQEVLVGDLVTVDVVASGLEAVVPEEIVSAYDLDVSYDPGILQALSVTFGSLLGFSLQNFDLSVPGVVDVAELSLESDTVLAALQPDSFILATLSFNAVGIGTSALEFVPDLIFGIDVKGRDAQVLSLTASSGSATVVPEPGTLSLLGSGLAVAILLRWQKQRV